MLWISQVHIQALSSRQSLPRLNLAGEPVWGNQDEAGKCMGLLFVLPFLLIR